MAATVSAVTPPNPYVGNRRLYNDVNGLPLRTIATQRAIIVGLLLAIVALAMATIVLTWQLGQRPIYAFGFDRVRVRDAKTNTVVTESTVPYDIEPMQSDDDQLHAAIASYWLPLFVENLYSVYGLDTDKRNLVRFVRPILAPGSPAVEAVRQYLRVYNPVQRAQQGHVIVTADPLAPPRAPNTYHVTWTARSYNPEHREVSEQTGGALITIAWGQPSPLFERTPGGAIVGGNPTGMFVTQIIPDRAVDPLAAPASP